MITTVGLATSFLDSGLTPDTVYYYVVSAFDEVPYESSYSNEACSFTPDTISPPTPTGVSLEVMPGGNTLNISWDPVLNLDLHSYILFRSLDNVTFVRIAKIVAGTEYYLDTNLADGTTYYYLVKAQDEIPNESNSSIIVKGTPQDTLAPQTPANLKATKGIVPGSVKLSWDENPEDDLVGYTLYYSKTSGGPYVWLATLGPEISYHIFDLEDGVTYYFVIDAFDEIPHNSTISSEVQYTTVDSTPPLGPTGLLAFPVDGGGAVYLVWNHNIEEDLDHYAIYVGNDNVTFIWLANVQAGTNEFTHSGLINNVEYFYIIAALDEVPNKSPMSNVASTIPREEAAPSIPTGLKVTPIQGTKALNISWNPSLEPDLDHYILYRSEDNVTFVWIANISADMNYYVDDDVEAGKTYYYKLSAVDSNMFESELSEAVFGMPSEEVTDEVEDFTGLILITLVLTIIVILILLLLLKRRKREEEVGAENEEKDAIEDEEEGEKESFNEEEDFEEEGEEEEEPREDFDEKEELEEEGEEGEDGEESEGEPEEGEDAEKDLDEEEETGEKEDEVDEYLLPEPDEEETEDDKDSKGRGDKDNDEEEIEEDISPEPDDDKSTHDEKKPISEDENAKEEIDSMINDILKDISDQ